MSEQKEDLNNIIKPFNIQPTSLVFHNAEQKEVGRLSFDPDGLKFEGIMDESADAFAEFLEERFNTKLKVYREALEKIARVYAMDYEYQQWAKEALEKI